MGSLSDVVGRGAFGVLLFRARYVLLERKAGSHPFEPGNLVFPGGTLGIEESPEAGLVREMAEEYGFRFSERDLTSLGPEELYALPPGGFYRVSLFSVRGWDGTVGSGTSSGNSEVMPVEDARLSLDSRRRDLLEKALVISSQT